MPSKLASVPSNVNRVPAPTRTTVADPAAVESITLVAAASDAQRSLNAQTDLPVELAAMGDTGRPAIAKIDANLIEIDDFTVEINNLYTTIKTSAVVINIGKGRSGCGLALTIKFKGAADSH